ncbi:hypothetical protein B0A49_03542 [Cryomyces minteri]|uniref:RNA polymerase II-associated protein 1 N-terminal domain-containing protein n=1 Tax=Cryomyces minteri TaxID=331657 RepID=A0A4U0XFW7_9PEZI|nr:hypothetical protein B0A49_03542 [Cryomyces minteri]
MAVQGERFHLALDSDDEDGDARAPSHRASAPPFNFVRDIQERAPAAPKPPVAPAVKSTLTGFPAHKKRSGFSRFKQQSSSDGCSGANRPEDEPSRAGRPASTFQQTATDTDGGTRFEDMERRKIDKENTQRLAEMSSEEIEQERQELLAGLNPSLIERLLKRANIDEGSNTSGDFPTTLPDIQSTKPTGPKATKKVTFHEPEEASPVLTVEPPVIEPDDQDEDFHLNRTSEITRPPPDLDPSSSTFLTDLHTKYFPSLPTDASKLAWMSSTPSSSSYSPTASALAPASIRFAFTGALLPPRTAAAIPVTAGLHHHGDAPDAAGYTIPELALLARSSYPSQRCIAFQTLGRILYRLGKGEFGHSGDEGEGRVGVEDTMGELARGLWRCVEHEKVVDVLVAEAEGAGRHLSAKAYATEAVWLWRLGGGRRWKAV